MSLPAEAVDAVADEWLAILSERDERGREFELVGPPAEIAEAERAASAAAPLPRVPRRRMLPARVRAGILARDGYACRLCGAVEDLTIDHIIPWSKGGADTSGNLRVLCRSCNSRKGDSA